MSVLSIEEAPSSLAPALDPVLSAADAAKLSHEERKRRTAQLLAVAHEATGAERDDLLEQVIILNIPVAHTLAGRYRNRGQDQSELEQVACLALTRVVQKFDPTKGEDLLVFAVPSILGELKRHFRDAGWSVRPPRRLQELRPRLTEAEELLTQVLGRPPTVAEIAEELCCPESEVEEAKASSQLTRTSSLDEPVTETGTPIGDLLSVVDGGFEHSESVVLLAPACRKLKKRDRWILRMRFYDQMTQQEIADQLGVTQVQVSRLLKRILDDLRAAIGELGELDAATDAA